MVGFCRKVTRPSELSTRYSAVRGLLQKQPGLLQTAGAPASCSCWLLQTARRLCICGSELCSRLWPSLNSGIHSEEQWSLSYPPHPQPGLLRLNPHTTEWDRVYHANMRRGGHCSLHAPVRAAWWGLMLFLLCTRRPHEEAAHSAENRTTS